MGLTSGIKCNHQHGEHDQQEDKKPSHIFVVQLLFAG